MFRGLLDSRYHYKCSLCEGLKKGSVSGSLTCITHRMSSRLLPILLDQERTVTTALPIITMMMHACVCAFATPWTITAHQVPLSMEFSRQECWSGLPFPSPGDLPYPGIEPRLTALQADLLLSEPPGKP